MKLTEKVKFKKIHDKANKASLQLKGCESELEAFFQPYFNEEIFVLYQEGDGFCIAYDVPDKAPKNEPVTFALKNIDSNENYYK